MRAAFPPSTSASAPAGSTLAALTRPRREGRGTRSPRERRQARPAAEATATGGEEDPGQWHCRGRGGGGESAARSRSSRHCPLPLPAPLRRVEQPRRATAEVTGTGACAVSAAQGGERLRRVGKRGGATGLCPVRIAAAAGRGSPEPRKSSAWLQPSQGTGLSPRVRQLGLEGLVAVASAPVLHIRVPQGHAAQPQQRASSRLGGIPERPRSGQRAALPRRAERGLRRRKAQGLSPREARRGSAAGAQHAPACGLLSDRRPPQSQTLLSRASFLFFQAGVIFPSILLLAPSILFNSTGVSAVLFFAQPRLCIRMTGWSGQLTGPGTACPKHWAARSTLLLKCISIYKPHTPILAIAGRCHEGSKSFNPS